MRILSELRAVSPAALLAVSSLALAGHSADPEIYQGSGEARTEPVALVSAANGAPQGTHVELSALGAVALNSADDGQPWRPLQVGVGREVPAPFNQALGDDALVWATDPAGGSVATIRLSSPGAGAVRAGIHVGALPNAAQLRFFSPGQDQEPVSLVNGADVNRALATDRAQRDADAQAPLLYWSPMVKGETLGMEIYLPPGGAPRDLRIAIPKLSHIADWPLDEALPQRSVGASLEPLGITDSGACTIDIGCHMGTWGDVAPAVARMYFTTSSGVTAFCSGTLIADQDPSSQVPYFLTARHCIQAQSEASSLVTFWLFRKPQCNGFDKTTEVKILNGGATLLAQLPSTDTTLLRLNEPPPAGTTMAGWDTNQVAANTKVTNISYPRGDLQKIAFGKVEGFAQCHIAENGAIQGCNLAAMPFGNTLYTTFRSGQPQQGSSGSGIFRDDTHTLVGVYSIVRWADLDGDGAVSCGDQVTQNYFGRFDQSWQDGLSFWLGRNNGCDAEPGSWAYCFNPACGPCQAGEGDCDGDAQCAEGLVCVDDVGADFGFESSVDVCVAASDIPAQPVCTLAPGDWGYCADPACGPCRAGEGDCDADNECIAGLACNQQGEGDDVTDGAVDVCELPSASQCALPVGDWAYCGNDACGPCGVGQGDCDSDAECADGLVCGFNRGADYGLAETLDVCVAPATAACARQPGDWGYCSDPACGPCTEGQGDCDLDADCADGLRCALNTGEAFGLPATMDVCTNPGVVAN